MRIVELFCGIGGFRYGLEKANEISAYTQSRFGDKKGQLIPQSQGSWRWEFQEFRCVYANDNDKYACQIYRKHWGNKELYEGDIRAVDPATIPEHDLICAGFPCQSFSIAGKRGGFQDTRGTLFFEIMRIARAKGTPYLLLENVKGLLSHDEGDTFQTILRTMDELGYDCQWQVLNSKDFGVPQNRERVFIIGHSRGQPRPKVFPIGEVNQDDTGQSAIYRRDSISRTLLANYGDVSGDGTKLSIMNKVRRLTPTECERLQGFPDGWTEGISDTQRYKTLGNAVTTNVITAIASGWISDQRGGDS